jgi:hypothetical protein
LKLWVPLNLGSVDKIKGWATLYNLVGVVKRHVECQSSVPQRLDSFCSYLLESF